MLILLLNKPASRLITCAINDPITHLQGILRALIYQCFSDLGLFFLGSWRICHHQTAIFHEFCNPHAFSYYIITHDINTRLSDIRSANPDTTWWHFKNVIMAERDIFNAILDINFYLHCNKNYTLCLSFHYGLDYYTRRLYSRDDCLIKVGSGINLNQWWRHGGFKCNDTITQGAFHEQRLTEPS